jgi:dnd system-associated protein 4
MDAIKQAALKALEILGKPSSVGAIYECIQKNGLYAFNTDAAEHVLDTTLKRHAQNSPRTDPLPDVLFVQLDGDLFWRSDKSATRRARTPGAKRIHRAKDKEATIAELTSLDLGVFKEIWRLLLFASMLGFAHKRREVLGEIDQGKGIDQATFGNSPTWPGILYLMAISETESEEVMTSSESAENLRITLFEEYANGGLSILQEKLSKSDLDLTSLIELVAVPPINEPGEFPTPDLSI